MIPIFTAEMDRTEYIESFLEGFGKKEVIKHYNTKEILENYDIKKFLTELTNKDIAKSLSKKEKEALINLLNDN